ncbi:MAG: hypothetical protein C0609_06250 [Deltaproteobacteria bacterium]|nr:MAG: hypothetical protein C0609_06250 [Deltaproteobacteria bacterium]
MIMGSWKKGFYALIAFFVPLIAVVTPYDIEITNYLRAHSIVGFREFMAQTIFEGDPPGGGDPVVIFIIISLLLYIIGNLRKAPEVIRRWRPFYGFILATSLTGSVVMVRLLKFFIGRARPRLVFGEAGLPFTNWYEIGPQAITKSFYHGSFPSGHTASVMCLVCLLYIYSVRNGRKEREWVKRFFLAIPILAYAALMALARTMSYAHWATDCLFSIVAVWAIAHLFFYAVLRVPEVMQRTGGGLPAPPKLWELRFSLYIALTAAGVIAFGRGSAELYGGWGMRSAIMAGLGFIIAIAAFRRGRLLRRRALGL